MPNPLFKSLLSQLLLLTTIVEASVCSFDFIIFLNKFLSSYYIFNCMLESSPLDILYISQTLKGHALN